MFPEMFDRFPFVTFVLPMAGKIPLVGIKRFLQSVKIDHIPETSEA